MRPARKLAGLVLAGIAFGVLVAAVKGQDGGVRDAVGNTSAPWVLVAFLVGTRCSRAWRGALAGAATTLAAFLGFYLAEAAILDLGARPWYVDLELTLGSGRVYEAWGLLSGSVYGALGAAWASRSLRAAAVPVGLAFVCEPFAVLLLGRTGVWGDGALWRHPWLWIAEVLAGAAGVGYVLTRPRALDPARVAR
jgi:hypothetical protein